MSRSAHTATHMLVRGGVHVWLMPEPPEPPDAFAEVLAASERQELASMAPAPARRFVCGRGLLRHTLSRYVDLQAAAWSFRRTGHGRPELSGVAGPSFNVSHTEGLVACAVSRGAVGVDVERGRRLQDPRALAKRFFHPEEAADVLESVGADAARRCFLRLWTLKEAHAKALGRGVTGQLATLRFPSPGLETGSTRGRTDLQEGPIAPRGGGAGWVGWHRNPTTLHHLAVVAKSGTELACHWLDAAGQPVKAALQ